MSAARFVVDDPFRGEIVAEIPLMDAREALAQVARSARAQRELARMPLADRVALCNGFVAAFETRAEEIARDVTRQMGKPIAQARGEVRTCLARARHMIEIAPQALAPDELPGPAGFARRITHEPVGVVLAIAAWNYPLLIPVNVVVPAVLAGNAVLIKHAARTPLCADAFARAFRDAGAPADLVAALHVDHPTAAEVIAAPEIGYVSFTGSVRGGREVHQLTARRFIDAGLELGGKDPVYVAPDADLDHAIENVMDGAFYNAGQSCCGVERVYVHRSLYDRFLEGAVGEARKLRAGDPMLETTTLGPMAQPDATSFLSRQVDEARRLGARVLCGGRATTEGGKGRFFEPAVVADATHEMSLMLEESFGPVVGVAPVDSDDEAIERMNDSRFGLTAAIWTSDPARADAVGRRVEAGTFFMNRCDYLDPALAWTGWKESGKGVSLSRWGFLPLTRRRSWHYRLHTR